MSEWKVTGEEVRQVETTHEAEIFGLRAKVTERDGRVNWVVRGHLDELDVWTADYLTPRMSVAQAKAAAMSAAARLRAIGVVEEKRPAPIDPITTIADAFLARRSDPAREMRDAAFGGFIDPALESARAALERSYDEAQERAREEGT